MKTLVLFCCFALAPALLAQSIALGVALQPPPSTIPAGQTDTPVFQFTLTYTSSGPTTPVSFTGATLTNTGTAGASDYTRVQLHRVAGTTIPTLVLVATANSPSFSFSGFTESLISGVPVNYAVTIDLPAGATHNATFIFNLAGNAVTINPNTIPVTGGPIVGSTHTISNSASVPDMEVRDSLGSGIPSGGIVPYDIEAVHGDTPVTGANYNFTIHCTANGPLNLTGSPDLVELVANNNCNVTITQPVSSTVATGNNVGFTLLIDPVTTGAFGLMISIDNNSSANPYVISMIGNAVSNAATHLVVVTQPGNGIENLALSTQPVVEAHGPAGRDLTFTGTVTATLQGGTVGAAFVGTAVISMTQGRAEYTNLGVDTAGTGYSIQFSSNPVLTGATSGTFNVTVAPGAADRLHIATQPVGAAPGAAFATQPMIEVHDASGILVPENGTLVSAAIASGPPTALFVGSNVVNVVNGVAQYTNLGIDTAGTYTLEFTHSGGLTPATSASVVVGTTGGGGGGGGGGSSGGGGGGCSATGATGMFVLIGAAAALALAMRRRKT